MSDFLGRAVRLVKSRLDPDLDEAQGRLEEIDPQAQEEMSRSVSRDDIYIPDPPPQSSSDPMARAQAKIAAAQQASAARREAPAARAKEAAPPTTDPVQTAYKIIGLPAGSDYAAVQQAVTKLRERCAPAHFPEGSEEQATAQVILQRVEEAFQVLTNALDPTASRFDRLEI